MVVLFQSSARLQSVWVSVSWTAHRSVYNTATPLTTATSLHIMAAPEIALLIAIVMKSAQIVRAAYQVCYFQMFICVQKARGIHFALLMI